MSKAMISVETIPYSMPSLAEADADAVAAVVRAGWLVMGAEVKRFEAAVAAFCGRRHAVATSSGTTALHLALAALGVGPGWEVLVPAYTWVATAAAPLWLGARVTLVDVDPCTGLMDRDDLSRALERGQEGARRLVMPVHLFGLRCGGEWLEALAARHGALVLGDGCCAFGGRDGELVCGAWTPIEAFSFHPRKVVACGEGGMLVLDDDELADRLRRLRDHGAVRSVEQRRQTGQGGAMLPGFPEPGFNFRMTELQGALGASQMARIDALCDGRRRVAAWYDEALRALGGPVETAAGSEEPGRVLTFYPARLVSEPVAAGDREGLERLRRRRDALLASLADQGIVARPPMIDLADLPWLESSRPSGAEALWGTRLASAITVGLPFYPDLRRDQVERVVDALGRAPR